MYILPTPTHLEVVALGDSSDISPDQHLNYASDESPPTACLSVAAELSVARYLSVALSSIWIPMSVGL